MCHHYTHTHTCAHTTTIFAEYCRPAAFRQTPCTGGDIWASFHVDTLCPSCETAAAPLREGVELAGRASYGAEDEEIGPGEGARMMRRFVEKKFGKGKGEVWMKGR